MKRVDDAEHRASWATLEKKPRFKWLKRLLKVGGGTFVLLFAAALFYPWYLCGCSTRVKAYQAAMKSDLKNLASQQEIYFSDAYSYSASFEDLAFANSDGVLIRVFADDKGWTAVNTHKATNLEGCAIYYGEVEWPMTTPAGKIPDVPGEVICDEVGSR